jgi:hypothetical protein
VGDTKKHKRKMNVTREGGNARAGSKGMPRTLAGFLRGQFNADMGVDWMDIRVRASNYSPSKLFYALLLSS